MIWIWIWMMASPPSCPAHSRLKTPHKSANQTTRYIKMILRKQQIVTMTTQIRYNVHILSPVPVQRDCFDWWGEETSGERRCNHSSSYASYKSKRSGFWWFRIEALQLILKRNMIVFTKMLCLFRQRNGPWKGWGERSGISSLLRRVARRRKFMLMA